MWNAIQNRPRKWIGFVSPVVFAGLMALEIADADEVLTVRSVFLDAFELALLVACSAVAAIWMLERVAAQDTKIDELQRDIGDAAANGEEWRERMRDHIRMLASGVKRQFDDWGMTDAEQDIGFLILKGFTFKEIAALRATSEATVRQQAVSIYRKADLNGRASFSAFFFEDLLSPGESGNGAQSIRPDQPSPNAARESLSQP